jgi:hypothetical protein
MMLPSQKKYILKIETTSYCNQECKFCPQSQYKLKNQVMPYLNFMKIVDSLNTLGIEIATVHFGGFGESFLDNQLFDKVYYARQHLTHDTTTTTNGKLLIGKTLQNANNCFSKVFFSFHGNTPEEYEKLTGNNFEEMKRIYHNAKHVLKNKLILVNHPEGKLRMLIEGKPPQQSDIHPFHNFADQWLTDKVKPYGIDASMQGQRYCEFNLFIIVRVDGSLCTCCNDWNTENNILTGTYPKCDRCGNKAIVEEVFLNSDGFQFQELMTKLDRMIKA